METDWIGSLLGYGQVHHIIGLFVAWSSNKSSFFYKLKLKTILGKFWPALKDIRVQKFPNGSEKLDQHLKKSQNPQFKIDNSF